MTDKTEKSELEKLGDLMKKFESAETGASLMPGIPIVARLDGRAFSSFTKSLERPFDMRFVAAMDSVTRDLVKEFGATCGYTQSDEITIAWKPVDPETSEIIFGGRIQKMVGTLAARASAKFAIEAVKLFPHAVEKAIPSFDCRIWQFPNMRLAAECFRWREADAIKNSVSMLASAHFSHSVLNGKSSRERKQMLSDKGVEWTDLPSRVKRGSYCFRVVSERSLSEEEMARIPESKRPSGPVLRSSFDMVELPVAARISNFVDVLFAGEPPAVATLAPSTAASLVPSQKP